MKYKVDLSPTIKNLAEWQLERYTQDKNQLADIERELIRYPTVNYNFSGGSRGTHEVSRPTEATAFRLLSSQYIQRMTMGVNAVEFALRGGEPTDLKLVSLVYWTKTNNVEGAAVKCNISKTAAYRRINDILICIAFGMGYLKFSDLKG